MGLGAEPARLRYDVRERDETGSTNEDLLALARAGASEGVVISTGHQTGGRGRRGRTWVAAPGSSLLASVLLRPVLLRPALAPDSAHLVTMAAALAAVDACAGVAGTRPALKWPNDLVVEQQGGRSAKLAGLLADALVSGDRLEAVVVGMGLNLTQEAADAFPGAVCLEALAGRSVDRQGLLAAWLGHLDRWYGGLGGDAGRRAVLTAYRRQCATVGREVRVELANRVFSGLATGVDGRGRLLVVSGSGRTAVDAGEVVHLRPTG